MAVLHRKQNANRRKRMGVIAGMAASVLVPTLAAVTCLVLLFTGKTLHPVFGAALLVLTAAGAGIFRVLCKRSAILKSGIEGEQYAAKLLKKLPDSCHVLVNPVFRVNGREMELDALAVSRNGIFIVETKNHSGVITGGTGDEFWKQEKRTETKQMKNPLRQIERQERLMNRLLENIGQQAPVYSCVYFANPNAEVRVHDERIFTDGETLCRAIREKKKLRRGVNASLVAHLLDKQCE